MNFLTSNNLSCEKEIRMQECEQRDGMKRTGKPMRALISGASGLIGSELSTALRASGVSVTALTRSNSKPGAIYWNPEASDLDPRLVSGFDAVVHLAGEPVGDGIWTQGKKTRIYNSRVQGTANLARALAAAEAPPRAFLCASGINYYPSSGDRTLDESAQPGTGFLSKVCVDWEQSAATLVPLARVAFLRIGVVLSSEGGTLEKMLPVFRLGLGGYVGSGDAYLSWITLDDLVRALHHILCSEHLQGPINIVAPEPVTGRKFAKSLGQVLGRPAHFRVPATIARLMLGEFAEETILSSVRATTAKLLSDGFLFKSQTIEQGLAECLRTKI